MKYPQEIVRTSLLGTKNSVVDFDIFPKELQTHLDTTQIKEQQFLDAISLYSAYLQGGNELKKLPNIAQNVVTLPKEELPYCTKEVNDFLEQMIVSQPFSMDTFFNALIEKIEGSLLPLEYMLRFETLTPKQLKAFGNRAVWLDHLKRQSSSKNLTQEDDYLSLNKNQRNGYFKELLIHQDIEKAKKFLEEVFEGETPSGKLGYLQIIDNYPYTIERTLFEPIQNYIDATDSTSKSYQKITRFYKQLLFIHDPKRTKIKDLYEKYFSDIWDKGVLKTKLKEPEALETLLQEIDAFNFDDSDEAMRFIFTVVPVEWWCKQLKWNLDQLLDYLLNMKNTYEKKQLISALSMQIKRNNNIDLLEAFLRIQKQNGFINYTHLSIIPDDKIIAFLMDHEKYLFDLEFPPSKVISYFKALRTPWNRTLSKLFLKLVFHYSHYNQDLLKNIWSVAPYIDTETMDELLDAIQEKHNHHVSDEMPVIIKIRALYQNL